MYHVYENFLALTLTVDQSFFMLKSLYFSHICYIYTDIVFVLYSMPHKGLSIKILSLSLPYGRRKPKLHNFNKILLSLNIS